jgi:hypothetical protein
MRLDRTLPWLALTLSLASMGCASAGGDDIGSVGPQTPHPAAPGMLVGPFVQAGAVFTMRLEQPIDTFYSRTGTPFTATVVTPLSGQDGRVLVPVGAKVTGYVASVGEPDAPRVRVDLIDIDTVEGTVPLHAAVRSAQHSDWVAPPTPQPYAEYTYSYDFLDYGSATAARPSSPPGRPVEGATMMQPREIRIPAGALVQVQLVDPLTLPGSHLRQ